MFFYQHTTPAEIAAGAVDRYDLTARFVKHRGRRSSLSGTIFGEVAIAIGKTYYELQMALDEQEPDESGLEWLEGNAEKRVMLGGVCHDFVEEQLPLTWRGLVDALCRQFKLDPNMVWAEGVDVHAFWAGHEKDSDDFKIPKKKYWKEYSLARLYGQERY